MENHLLYRTFLASIVTLAVSVPPCMSQDNAILKGAQPLVPERDIQYASQEPPVWKVTWDQAREMSRSGRYVDATDAFSILLENKPNLNEARWEYISILLHLNEWIKAEKELNILLAKGQENRAYDFALAKIALHTDEYSRAEQIYHSLLTTTLDQRETLAVADGLSQALLGQGKNKQALPWIEQLLILQPDNLQFQRRAMLLYTDEGNFLKGYGLVQAVVQAYPDDPEVLESSARLAEGSGDLEAAATYWQQLVAIEPDNPTGNLALINYYMNKGNLAMELVHLERLKKSINLDPALSKRRIELYLANGRADKALELCDALLTVFPDDVTVLARKQESLQTLAANLLALVENSGSQLLWEDLSDLTHYRVEVYKIMADMLRERGEVTALTDLLIIIAKEVPETDPVWKELTQLLTRQGRTQELAALQQSSRLADEKQYN